MKKFLFSTLLLLAFLPLAQAQTRVIDGIIAIVEDDVITRNELVREVQRIRDEFASQGKSLPISASLNRQVLELMITKSVLLQEAKRRGVVITDTQLNGAMQNLARRNNMTLALFREAILANGLSYDTFRDDVKNEMMINTIKASYARQNVEVTDVEVDDFIKRSGAGAESVEYKLSHILIALPDGANSDQVSDARARADEIITKLNNGDNFAVLASEYSEGGNALQGGDLGWRKLAEIPSLFANLVSSMQPGQFQGPLRSASGFHIVLLEDRRDSERVLVNETHARHILIRTDEITNEQQAQQKIEELRQQILEGADFAELAKQHSDDPGSKGLGGDLGWFGDGVMVPEFQQVLDNSQIGEISEPFSSPFGWHILQVLERRTSDETEDSKRKKIRAQLEEQKKTEVLELWQRRLRDQAFVKINDA